MDLKLVCHYIFLAIFISAQTSLAVETYDDLYIGCFKDNKNNRVLPDAELISNDITIELCINHCKGLTDIDSAYAGVENSKECFCGVAGTNYSRLGVAGDGDCNFPCAGEDTTYCGGLDKISIYNLFLIRPPTTPAASTQFERDESTVPISTHSAKSDELYVGCYRDEFNDRVLPDAQLISDDMTIELCIDYCTGLNDIDSAYAGVEFARECFCGVAGRNYGRYGVAEDSECNWRCAGDDTTYCGGIRRISIYNLLLIRAPTTPAASTPFESTIPISTHSAKSEAVTSSSVSTYTGSTTKYNMSTGSSLGNTGSSLVPTLIGALVPLFAITIFVLLVCLLCRPKWHKHESSQGIAASGEHQESPVMKDNPTFESSNVHDLRKSDAADCHGGNDQYIALTTPHDGRSAQVYQTLGKVISEGDGYEVPLNGANGQTGPEYGKTLHKLQEHPGTDYEIAHEYQDITNSIVGRNTSRNESPIRGLQVQPETDYEAIHEYEDPGIIR